MSVIRRVGGVARLPAAAAGRVVRAGIRFVSTRDAGTPPMIDDLHLVLEPDRAAASALAEVLRAAGVQGALHTAHSLCGPELPGWDECPLPKTELVRMGEEGGRSWERVLLHRRVWDNAFGAGCPRPRRMSVVCAVREPVHRWIAMLFGTAQRHPSLLDPASLTAEQVSRYLTGESRVVFPWLQPGEWWDYDGWIRRELGERMGFDVFGAPFDHSRGWRIYEGVDARLLLIRHESMTRLPEAVGAFYGVPPATVPPPRDDGALPEQYLQVLDQIRLPDALLDRVYSTALVRRFYAPHEIREFRERWSEHRR